MSVPSLLKALVCLTGADCLCCLKEFLHASLNCSGRWKTHSVCFRVLLLTARHTPGRWRAAPTTCLQEKKTTKNKRKALQGKTWCSWGSAGNNAGERNRCCGEPGQGGTSDEGGGLRRSISQTQCGCRNCKLSLLLLFFGAFFIKKMEIWRNQTCWILVGMPTGCSVVVELPRMKSHD